VYRRQTTISSYKYEPKNNLTRATRQVKLVEQELLTLPEHLSSPGLLMVRVAQSLVFYVVFCESLYLYVWLLYWQLYCLSFDLWLLITRLVSSSFPDLWPLTPEIDCEIIDSIAYNLQMYTKVIIRIIFSHRKSQMFV